jgi:hypothetical protein
MGGQRHGPAALSPGNRPGTYSIKGWVGPRASKDGCGKYRPHWDSMPVRPARSKSQYRLRQPGPHYHHHHHHRPRWLRFKWRKRKTLATDHQHTSNLDTQDIPTTMTYPHSLSLHMKVSHIRYHVPNCQTKEYRGGAATALSILTSDQLFYFQEDRFWYPLRNVVDTRTHLDVMTMKEIPSPVRYRTPDENHTANHFSDCSQRQYGTTSRRWLFKRREKCTTKK